MKYNLSEIIGVIKDRRTIYPQFFSNRKIHKEILEKLLQSATWAPTHGMTQPWFFHVYTEEAREKLADFLGTTYKKLAEKKFDEGKWEKITSRPKLSQAAIVVSMKRQKSGRIPEIEEIQAVSAAIQNILITATAYGIGSFWNTPKLLQSHEAKTHFGLAEKDKIMGIIYLGYPSEEWPKGQRKPIEYVSEWIT